MPKHTKSLLLTLVLFSIGTSLYADEEPEEIPPLLREGEWIPEPPEQGYPFRVEAIYRGVGSAKFTEGSRHLSSMRYADSLDTLSFSHPIADCHYLTWQVGYSYLKLDWDKNPRFRQESFNYAMGSVTWAAQAIENWRFLFNLTASVDGRRLNFGNSGVYNGMGWARYTYSDCLHFHLGFFGYVGVKNHYVLPIAGLDWSWQKWKLNAIFPLDFSLTYAIDCNWSAAVAFAAFGGPYRFPRRAGKGIGDFKNAIFEVYSKGVELDLTYQLKPRFSVGLGAGWNFGGWILIKDAHNHHGKYFKFDSAPYAQANASFSF